MRYSEGGGLTAERRAFREGIRLQAGERFAAGEESTVIAKDLRVSAVGGTLAPGLARGRLGGFAIRGPGRSPTVSDSQFAVLEEAFGRDRRNTASRISVGRWPEYRRCSTSAAA